MEDELDLTPGSCDHLNRGWCSECMAALWRQRRDLVASSRLALKMLDVLAPSSPEDRMAVAEMKRTVELARQGKLGGGLRVPPPRARAPRDPREWQIVSSLVDAYFSSDMPKVATPSFDGHMQELRTLWRERLGEEETIR